MTEPWSGVRLEAEVVLSIIDLVEAGAEPPAEPTEKPWGQTVSFVRDINGVIVEICSPADG